MGLKGIILSGHNSIGVEGWGELFKLVMVEKQWNRIGGLNCNFFLNIFVFYVSTSFLYNKNWVNRLEVSFLKERSMATIATVDLDSIHELYEEVK